MMIRTSKDFVEFGEMYDAIKRAMDKNHEPLDFLADLHEGGFMVVPVDVMIAPLLERFETGELKVPPPPLRPSHELQIEAPDDMPTGDAFQLIEWWRGVRNRGGWIDENNIDLSTAAWIKRFKDGLDADAAFTDADTIPF